MTEGETYAIFLNWKAQSGAIKRFNTSVYEDERMLTSHDDTGWNYTGIIVEKYQPRADAKHLVVEVSQGSKVVARKVIDIKIADAREKETAVHGNAASTKRRSGFRRCECRPRTHFFRSE